MAPNRSGSLDTLDTSIFCSTPPPTRLFSLGNILQILEQLELCCPRILVCFECDALLSNLEMIQRWVWVESEVEYIH
jgi:hypothetical protein